MEDDCASWRDVEQKFTHLLVYFFKVVSNVVHSAVASSLVIVCAHEDSCFGCIFAVDRIFFETFGRIEVEYEEESASFIN